MTVAAGLSNDGTILLESQNSGYSDALSTGSGTFTNAADGIIQVTAGTGGTRTITGNLTNLGAINVGAGTTLGVNYPTTAATFVNEGQVTVDPAGLMYVTSTYNAAGGTITGPGYVYNGTLLVTVSTASPTTILVDGTGTYLATNNLPNTTIWVQGNASLGGVNATLTVAAGLRNDGTILLESQNSGYTDTLATGSGTFTNAADGIIQVTAGTGGGRTITGNLTNLGAINVGAGTTLAVNYPTTAATFVNEGQVTVDPAGLMYVTSTYNAAGGTITGPGYVYNGTLLVTVSTASPTTILVDGTGTYLATNNLPNTTIWVQGNASFAGVNPTLTVAAGLSNDGTILLESQNSGYTDTLATGSGTFTNAADGTIQSAVGSGGARSITGNLTNLGLISVASSLTMSAPPTNLSAGVLSGGTWSVGANSSISIGGDITTDAANIILSGSSAQILDQNGKNALANLADISAGASFTIQNGANFTTARGLSNAGNITIGAGTTLTGNLHQVGGTTNVLGILNGTTISSPTPPGAGGALAFNGVNDFVDMGDSRQQHLGYRQRRDNRSLGEVRFHPERVGCNHRQQGSRRREPEQVDLRVCK